MKLNSVILIPLSLMGFLGACNESDNSGAKNNPVPSEIAQEPGNDEKKPIQPPAQQGSPRQDDDASPASSQGSSNPTQIPESEPSTTAVQGNSDTATNPAPVVSQLDTTDLVKAGVNPEDIKRIADALELGSNQEIAAQLKRVADELHLSNYPEEKRYRIMRWLSDAYSFLMSGPDFVSKHGRGITAALIATSFMSNSALAAYRPSLYAALGLSF